MKLWKQTLTLDEVIGECKDSVGEQQRNFWFEGGVRIISSPAAKLPSYLSDIKELRIHSQ